MTHTTRFFKISSRFLVGAGMVAVTVFSVAPSFASADTLYRQLQIGSTGSDVGSLQIFLASDAALYPEARVTNYFGTLTSSAVSRFQVRNGISAVGRVGPITLVALNAQMAGAGADISAPIISGVSVGANNSTASVSWSTNELARGVVYYSTSPIQASETMNTITISGMTASTDTTLRGSQMISLPNLQSNTTYYYMIYSSDAGGNVNVTWPSTFRTI